MFNLLRSDDPYARGFRDGLRGILAIGRYDAAHPLMVRRRVGSFATDSVERHRDMRAFGVDVERGRRDVIDE